jgi:RND family efflux transporter MFP subunit
MAMFTACRHEEKAVDPAPADKAVKVKTIRVTAAATENQLRYSGTVEPSLTIPLLFQGTGIVEIICVDNGDAVKKGQLLASLDKKDMKNIYQVALSKYQQAKDAYDRLKTVHDQGSLAEIKWVEMETGYEQAKTALAMAQDNLDKTDLRAPADGVIGSRNVEVGQSTIGLTTAHFKLVDIKTVHVRVSVPENEIGRIGKDRKATITVPALDNKPFEGMVTNLSPVAEAISHTYTVKIEVKNPDLELKPGMVGEVTIALPAGSALLTVPYKAVSKDNDGQTYVYIVTDDEKRVRKQVVTVGHYRGADIEILGGLSEGQTIVSDGCGKLSDNCLISL